jgi:hypothetical protein
VFNGGTNELKDVHVAAFNPGEVAITSMNATLALTNITASDTAGAFMSIKAGMVQGTNIVVRRGGAGLSIAMGAHVDLQNAVFESVGGAAISASGAGTHVQLGGLAIRADPSIPGAMFAGISAEEGASVAVASASIEGMRGFGIESLGAGSAITGDHVAIRSMVQVASSTGALAVLDGAGLSLDHVIVSGPIPAGVRVRGVATATISASDVFAASDPHVNKVGAVVSRGGSLRLSNSRIQSSAKNLGFAENVHADGAGSVVRLSDVVSSSAAASGSICTGVSGVSLHASNGARLEVRHAALYGNCAGILVESGSSALVSYVSMANEGSYGVQDQGGSRADIDHLSIVQANQGVLLEGENTSASISDLEVCGVPEGTLGLRVGSSISAPGKGATLIAKRVHVQNHVAIGDGTLTASISDLAIDSLRCPPPIDTSTTAALEVRGAPLMLFRARIVDAPITIADKGASATITDLSLDEMTRVTDGLTVRYGARADLARAKITNANRYGAYVFGDPNNGGSTLNARDFEVVGKTSLLTSIDVYVGSLAAIDLDGFDIGMSNTGVYIDDQAGMSVVLHRGSISDNQAGIRAPPGFVLLPLLENVTFSDNHGRDLDVPTP